MEVRAGIGQALDEFAHHKLRTLLTLLGMIFGVGAVISMMSIGKGGEREALKLIDALGLRNVVVESIPPPEERLREQREESLGLTRRDLEVALLTVPDVVRHSAVKTVRAHALFSHTGRSDAEVLGVSPSFFAMTNLALGTGRLLTDADDRSYAQVCVIGARASRDLFGTADPLGHFLKVNHVWLRVVGVLADRPLAQQEFEGVELASPQNRIYLPLETSLKRFRFRPMEDELDSFWVELGNRESVHTAAAILGRLLETRHRGVNDYRLIVPESLLEQHRQTQRIFDIVMASIAGISLLVGGIGIMNIMLATVLERTSEIGIRRAMGARRADIRQQFLLEALTISFSGGLLGIVIGFALAAAISWYSGWPFAWSMTAPPIGVAVCVTIGVLFGLYPAVRASQLDPVEALNCQL